MHHRCYAGATFTISFLGRILHADGPAYYDEEHNELVIPLANAAVHLDQSFTGRIADGREYGTDYLVEL